jgi:hypothetical protein
MGESRQRQTDRRKTSDAQYVSSRRVCCHVDDAWHRCGLECVRKESRVSTRVLRECSLEGEMIGIGVSLIGGRAEDEGLLGTA